MSPPPSSEDKTPNVENHDLRERLMASTQTCACAPALNQLHVVALNEGLQRKKALWPAGRNELESSASLFSWRSTVEPDTTGFLSSSATISCSVSCINFSGSVSFTTASHSSRQLSLSDITHPQKTKEATSFEEQLACQSPQVPVDVFTLCVAE
jgi:hypothetical protein